MNPFGDHCTFGRSKNGTINKCLNVMSCQYVRWCLSEKCSYVDTTTLSFSHFEATFTLHTKVTQISSFHLYGTLFIITVSNTNHMKTDISNSHLSTYSPASDTDLNFEKSPLSERSDLNPADFYIESSQLYTGGSYSHTIKYLR